jgi:aspartate/methionine/tyrosine aminotransferase
MTGWRVGWLVAPPEVAQRAIAVHQHLVTCAPAASQHAGLAAFDERGLRGQAAIVERFRRRRDVALAALARGGLAHAPPDGAFYVFVDVARGGPSLDVCRRLLDRRRVITIPGVAFGPGGEGWLRVSYAAPEEAIVAGIDALAEELAQA